MKCVDERASNSIIDAARSSDNFYAKGLADQDLIAREAHYQTSCYKIFTKPGKVPSHNDSNKEAEGGIEEMSRTESQAKNNVFYRTC